MTQAFNTTTSMGRLTLNVLLSFAQFEREVTGERIRDKIAASTAPEIETTILRVLRERWPEESDDRALIVRHLASRNRARHVQGAVWRKPAAQPTAG